MRFYFLITFICISYILKKVSSDNAYNNCAEVGTQRHVAIDQLMGLWYGIELISHRIETSYEPQHPDTCLQINISEEPQLGEDQYRSTYYNRHKYDNRNKYDSYDTITSTQYPLDSINQNRRLINQHQYNRNGVYPSNDLEQRKLKVLWIGSDGIVVTYKTSYMSAPGIWHISGPHNGSQLIQTFDDFAGTIQVLKAVGDHMVLTFCQIRPDQKLYTVILSRLPELKRRDILSIHNMLTVRGLDIVSVRNVCPVAAANMFTINLVLMLISCGLLSMF
nr:uncharacterized protein LOC111427832 [Onthophagus taurus]